jgi:hypothetical protein
MAFALIAMAIRAAVPVGFMLAPDHDRWVVMTLCSGSGPMQMALNLDTGEHRDGSAPTDGEKGGAAHHAPCVFAAATNLAPPDPLFEVAHRPATIADSAPALSGSVAIGRGLAAPPPWATGPPRHRSAPQ